MSQPTKLELNIGRKMKPNLTNIQQSAEEARSEELATLIIEYWSQNEACLTNIQQSAEEARSEELATLIQRSEAGEDNLT
jgi:hypothetical protein